MLEVTLNESEVIEKALKGEYDSNHIMIAINLLIKHYYIEGMQDRLKLREQILNFLKNYYKGYKRAKWEDTITKKVDRFLSTVRKNKIDVKVTDIKEIKITNKELETINNLNDIKLEKIAFVMLVYAKISNTMMDTTEGWINKSCATICKEAKVNLKGNEKEKIFNNLYAIGYIEQRKHNAKTNMKICYINEESEIELIINDFEGIIYQYLIWKGEKWKRCEDCGKWIKIKGKKPPQYCKECKKKKQLEWDKQYKKRARK